MVFDPESAKCLDEDVVKDIGTLRRGGSRSVKFVEISVCGSSYFVSSVDAVELIYFMSDISHWIVSISLARLSVFFLLRSRRC
jgi:hypothetical protein